MVACAQTPQVKDARAFSRLKGLGRRQRGGFGLEPSQPARGVSPSAQGLSRSTGHGPTEFQHGLRHHCGPKHLAGQRRWRCGCLPERSFESPLSLHSSSVPSKRDTVRTAWLAASETKSLPKQQEHEATKLPGARETDPKCLCPSSSSARARGSRNRARGPGTLSPGQIGKKSTVNEGTWT